MVLKIGTNYMGQKVFSVSIYSSKKNAKIAILEILNYLNQNKCLSSLAVLKLHGNKNSNFLSFPLRGYSLAMDFPYSENIKMIFEELDKKVLSYGGKIYLTKDTRLSSFFFKSFIQIFFK